jgi:peptidoglycan hydrolase-like protein with peptidoglycan-binding domain
MNRRPGIAVAAVAIAAAGLTTAAGLTAAAPAHANVAQGFVAGTTQWLSDDWADEGEVATNSHAYSGATGLWQAVLWADGAIERDGTRFDEGDIDCEFGPNTYQATRDWQAKKGGLSVDGRAGKNTWTAAGSQLRLHSPATDGAYNIEYVGRYDGRRFTVVRFPVDGSDTSGRYLTTSWDWSFFPYGSKPSECSGLPRGLL